MLLADMETLVRMDLFDPVGGANMRWQTSDIDRAIDKAVEEYSRVYPDIVAVDMPAVPYQRTYPYPAPVNPNYPVWWIEKILYPLQVSGSQFAPPGSAPTATVQSGSGLGVGTYQYAVTFLSQGGETTPSPVVSIATTSGNQQVALANIPPGPSPNSAVQPTVQVLARVLYRTTASGSTLFYLATIPDNMTTTFVDTTPDSALNVSRLAPTVNTSGMMVYPPIERAFSEFSNLFDTSVALGNNATGPAFTLQIADTELPPDASQIIRVHYACKHQLDNNGSTIPEVHRDVIVLGAVAYAILAYQVPTNDNFEFQDGELRDRLDDSKIPAAWLARGMRSLADFRAKLTEIKRLRDYAVSVASQWGDIPARWDRT
jgi:hypothetical protein